MTAIGHHAGVKLMHLDVLFGECVCVGFHLVHRPASGAEARVPHGNVGANAPTP